MISVSTKQFYYLERDLVVPKNELKMELELGREMFNDERFDFPWTLEAHQKVIAIRNQFRNKNWQELYNAECFPIQVFVEELRNLNLETIEPCKLLWGKALVAFFFVSAMIQSEHADYKEKYSPDDLALVTDIVLRLLETAPRRPWAVVLAFTVDQLGIATKWNNADSQSNDRRSEEMRLWLEKNRIRERLVEYNDHVPFEYDAPFSALAIASRFEERDSYKGLLKRIKRAKRFASLENAAEAVLKDKDADEDFDDFRCWVQEILHMPNEKEAA